MKGKFGISSKKKKKKRDGLIRNWENSILIWSHFPLTRRGLLLILLLSFFLFLFFSLPTAQPTALLCSFSSQCWRAARACPSSSEHAGRWMLEVVRWDVQRWSAVSWKGLRPLVYSPRDFRRSDCWIAVISLVINYSQAHLSIHV